jgi:hypothetical protein
VEVLTPAQVQLAVERIRDARRGRYRAADPVDPDPDPTDVRPTAQAAEAGPAGNVQPTPKAADRGDNHHLRPTAQAAEPPPAHRPAAHAVDAETRPAAHGDAHLRPTPLAPTDQDQPQLLPTTPEADLHTAVTVSRATAPDQDPISPVDETSTTAPGPCPNHPTQPAGHRPDDRLACVFCRALARTTTADRPVLRVLPGGAA